MFFTFISNVYRAFFLNIFPGMITFVTISV